MKPTRLDYCQYLLVSPINHTLTHFADHTENMSHDAINRFLRDDRMTPRLVWDNVRDSIEVSAGGYIVFDDTIIDKNFSHQLTGLSGVSVARRASSATISLALFWYGFAWPTSPDKRSERCIRLNMDYLMISCVNN